MKLDRNIEGNDGRGKYAILKLRKLAVYDDQKTFGGLPPAIEKALTLLANEGILDWGEAETESEFFLIKLRDKHARSALLAYAGSVLESVDGDEEYANEVRELASRAGPMSPYCKAPD